MCDVVQRIKDDGIKQGIEQGKEEAVRNLLEANAGTVEQIAAWLKLPIGVVKQVAEKVPVVN